MSAQHNGPVVAGVDGSETALDAVRWAAAEAGARGTGLRLLAVFTPLPDQIRHSRGMIAAYEEQMREELADHLRAAAEVAAEAAEGVGVETQLLTGRPEHVLVTESHAASLTVVGSRGLGRLSGLLVGSVAVAVAARGGSPVLVVRGDQAQRAKLPVVLGVEGSPAGEAAISIAFEMASRWSVPLRAVHAWSDSAIDWTATSGIEPEALASIEADERRLLVERLTGWSEDYPEVAVEPVVVRDRAASKLIEESAGAGLVVVGSRGRGGLAGLLLGSVSQSLLHHAQSPVLIARP